MASPPVYHELDLYSPSNRATTLTLCTAMYVRTGTNTEFQSLGNCIESLQCGLSVYISDFVCTLQTETGQKFMNKILLHNNVYIHIHICTLIMNTELH